MVRNPLTIKTKIKVLSIAISNECIKICEVTKNGKSILLHRAITVLTPEKSYYDGVIEDMQLLAKTIRMALDENQVTTSHVIFSITSTKIATKDIIIPNVKSNRIEEIVQTNASEYFPVNVEEYIIQYTLLEHLNEEENRIKLHVMAAPSDMIEGYYSLASALSLVIQSVDYSGNSTNQVLKRQISADPSLVVQIENDATLINIFQNNVLQLQRTIPYGKSILVNAVMEICSVSYEDAWKKLLQESLLHTSLDGDETTESLRYLINNINRIIDYYTSRNSQSPMEKAYIVGDATSMVGFTDLVSGELRLNFVRIESLQDVTVDKKSYVDVTELTDYITNIGAVIDPVNFIPKNMTEDSRQKEKKNFMKIMLLSCIVVSLAMVIIPLLTMLSAKSNRDTLQKNVDSIKSVEKIVNNYYEQKDMASDAEAFRNLTINHDDALGDFISVLEHKLPSDISIRNMTVTGGMVTVSGNASSKISIALLIQNLSAVENVSNVKVGSETESKDGNGTVSITFSLTCRFTAPETASKKRTQAAE